MLEILLSTHLRARWKVATHPGRPFGYDVLPRMFVKSEENRNEIVNF